MSFINVKIIDKDTLELTDDAKAGDRIDLTKITTVDLSLINELINTDKEKEIQKRIDAAIEQDRKEREELIRADEKANSQKEYHSLSLKYTQKESDYESLKKELNNLKEQQDTLLKLKESEIRNTYSKEIDELKTKISNLSHEHEINLLNNKIEFEKEFDDERDRLNKEFLKKENEYKETISALQRSKAMLNVKNIGEDLETWCDREIQSYMQNGFSNCTWSKDNTVVKEEGETKGSKADFIFNIYEDASKKELLTSICLEMKDENPDSINRKSNKDYYNQLDKNRKKKSCEYALLVSNLESDKPNEPLITKVTDYENMYMVRPSYMVTFLNMVVSLHTKFRKLIESSKAQYDKLKQYNELTEEFNKIKASYLEKPLESLEKHLEELVKQNENIIKANSAITQATMKLKETIRTIQDRYIQEIAKKIEKFEVSVRKTYKRYD